MTMIALHHQDEGNVLKNDEKKMTRTHGKPEAKILIRQDRPRFGISPASNRNNARITMHTFGCRQNEVILMEWKYECMRAQQSKA